MNTKRELLSKGYTYEYHYIKRQIGRCSLANTPISSSIISYGCFLEKKYQDR